MPALKLLSYVCMYTSCSVRLIEGCDTFKLTFLVMYQYQAIKACSWSEKCSLQLLPAGYLCIELETLGSGRVLLSAPWPCLHLQSGVVECTAYYPSRSQHACRGALI